MANNFWPTRLAIVVVYVLSCLVDGDSINCLNLDSCDSPNGPTCPSNGTPCNINCSGNSSCTTAYIRCATNADCVVNCIGSAQACRSSIIYCPPWPFKCEVTCLNNEACYDARIEVLNSGPYGPLRVNCTDPTACGNCYCRDRCTSSQYICGDGTCVTTPTTCSQQFGLVSSCSLENRIFTLEITAIAQNTSVTYSDGNESDNNCDDFRTFLEDDIADLEEIHLDHSNSTGGCNVESTGEAILTVSQYEHGDMSHCVDLSGGQFEVVSAVLDIDLANYEEFADVFVFETRYSLNPGSLCENDIDESSSITCEWFDVETEKFSSSGCQLLGIKRDGLDTIAICECQHLTAFAILHDTLKYKDNCNSSNVFGNRIWIVYLILYPCIMIAAFFQIRKMYGLKKSFKDMITARFVLHFQIVFICILNISIAATFVQVDPGAPGNFTIASLYVAWSTLYVLSFWMYSIVVYTWASVYHKEIGNSIDNYVKYVFTSVGAIIAVLIVSIFITAAIGDENGMRVNVNIGSTVIAAICLLLALAYLCYGILIVRKLKNAAAVIKSNNDRLGEVMDRITKVVYACFGMFLGQTIVVLISGRSKEVFFSNFATFQACYLTFDVVLLIMTMSLFYKVIRTEFDKKENDGRSDRVVSARSSGVARPVTPGGITRT